MLVAWLSLSCSLSRTAVSTMLQALLLIYRLILTPSSNGRRAPAVGLPSAWAVHQIMAWFGLERYGSRVAYRWLWAMTTLFTLHGGCVVGKVRRICSFTSRTTS